MYIIPQYMYNIFFVFYVWCLIYIACVLHAWTHILPHILNYVYYHRFCI